VANFDPRLAIASVLLKDCRPKRNDRHTTIIDNYKGRKNW